MYTAILSDLSDYESGVEKGPYGKSPLHLQSSPQEQLI